MPARFIAAVDMGATNVRVVIANEDGEIEARRAGPLPPGPPEDVLAKIGRTIDELVKLPVTTKWKEANQFTVDFIEGEIRIDPY